MLCNLFFLLALLCGSGAGTGTAVRPQHLHPEKKITRLSGDALIDAACKGVGDNVTDCVSTLKAAPQQAKADAHGLTLFTLGFVEQHAENITESIKKINAMPEVPPLLQAALTDCMDQYNSLDDLIEDATIAVQSKTYQDAQKFLMASLTGLDLCDTRLKDSDFEEKVEKKTGADYEMATALYKHNVIHRKLLFAALNILSIE